MEQNDNNQAQANKGVDRYNSVWGHQLSLEADIEPYTCEKLQGQQNECADIHRQKFRLFDH
jgi:hypothetical protein